MKNNKRGFTLNRHAEKSLLSIPTTTNNTQGRDPEQKLLRMALYKGFTLIELLIVVLIIGVLTAIAVPQYQKAVLKSRFSSLMPTTKSIRDGNEMYYMTNGHYADNVSKLDVTTTNNDDMTITVSDDMDYAYTMSTRPNIKNNLIMYQKHSVNFPGEIHCEAKQGDKRAKWLCKTALYGKQIGGSITEGYATYILEGTGNGMTASVAEDMQALNCDKAISMGYTCTITDKEDGTKKKSVCTASGVCSLYDYDTDGGYTRTTCQLNASNVCETKWEHAYDANGNKIYEVKCAHTVSTTGECNSYSPDGTYHYKYDEDGNLLVKLQCTQVKWDKSCYNYASYPKYYEYDSNGNKISERSCTTVASDGKCSKYFSTSNYDYTYDAKGNITAKINCKTVESDGSCSAYDGGTYYGYDAQGNQMYEHKCQTVALDRSCSEYSTSSSSNYDYIYDANRNQIAQRYCKTVESDGKCSSYSGTGAYVFTYDENGMTSKRWCSNVSSDGSCLAEYSSSTNAYDYKYDEHGNMISERKCTKVEPNGSCSAYSTGNENKDYTYDADGTRTSTKVCSSVGEGGKCDAYKSASAIAFTYDDDGSPIYREECQTWNETKTQCEEWGAYPKYL